MLLHPPHAHPRCQVGPVWVPARFPHFGASHLAPTLPVPLHPVFQGQAHPESQRYVEQVPWEVDVR